MATFLYQAMDKGGKEIRGRIKAGGEAIVVERLREMGYFPTQVKKIRSERAGDVNLEQLPGIRQLYRLLTGGRVRLQTLSAFTRELATLIGAGLPLLRSLEILSRHVKSTNLQRALDDVRGSVESGCDLSEGLARHPEIFSPLYVNMIRAGEIGGALEEILNRLATYQEKTAAVRGKILSALYYPVSVLVIATGLVTLILTFIVPRLQEIYEGLGVRLPALTRLLIEMSQVVRYQALWVIGGGILALLILWQFGKTRLGRRVLDQVRLSLPVLGVLVRKAAVARFARTLATLLDAGVPILQALVIVRDACGNSVLARASEDIHAGIREGGLIAEALERHAVFPELVVQMVAVGEETGTLDHMLNKVAESYERQVDHLIDGLTALIEPVLIVMLGVLIGFIVIALYMPLIKPDILTR